MKPETLESLLIDRALNELSPEVCELLAAYLAQNPIAVVDAAELEEAVALAREAVPVPDAAPARRLTVGSAPRSARWDWLMIPRLELARLAACLALGLAFGLGITSLWKAPVVVSEALPKPALIAKAEVPQAAQPSAQFWAVTAMRQKRPEALQPTGSDRIQWDRLFHMPRLEEKH